LAPAFVPAMAMVTLLSRVVAGTGVESLLAVGAGFVVGHLLHLSMIDRWARRT
jgi:hypothetical protein